MLNPKTIVEKLYQQALLYPENVAIDYHAQKLTYQQLDYKSNQLANYLKSRGIQRNSMVPICVSRSTEMIIGLLGILKAGAAYVPIDPNFPTLRIQHILRETSSALVLSSNQHHHKFSTDTILLDEHWPIISEFDFTSVDVEINPSDLAYIIFTSGSTGTPKGVMIEHQSLLSYIAAQTQRLEINDQDRILQFSNFCFDASVEQMFLALLNGATLVLVDEETLADPLAFGQFLETKSITHLHATPGFIENIPSGDYKKLKRIISAGDTCSKALAKRWASKVHFYNKYGPTETTISVLEYRCVPESIEDYPTLPLGKPFSDVTVYVLDESLQVLKENQIGEIFIGGIQLSRGYLNEPGLTEEAFIKSPFDETERLYKTGDLGHWNADGNLSFNGRIDHQVKIRGYRIELGEIESALNSAPSVKQCVVTAAKDHNGSNYLIGYVVAENFDKREVEAFLSTRIPGYMIPGIWVELNQLPLNSNGKTDRKALPIPNPSNLVSTAYIAPSFPTEEKIAVIWKELLQLSRVGTKDNFFELGGTSLTAQKLVNQLRDHQFLVPITKLYQTPTIAGIAAFLDGRSTKPVLKNKTAITEDSDIAIVGMAARLPGANSISEFWKNLTGGVESIRFFKNEELDQSISAHLRDHPNYVKARGIIDQPAAFDPGFFGINPKLAELMDPQQRIFLEVSWEALESSGHIPGRYDGSIGVFAGCRFNTYYTNNVLSNQKLIDNVGAFQVGTVSDKDYIATRTAFSLDLKGPAINVQSACSTSLVAVIQAVESIRSGTCEVAIAGGSSMLVPVHSGHLYEEGAILSADGHCKPFDAKAEGTIFSDGAAVVILKNRKLAERDGDTIYALIKGVGLSNDGGQKASFTAPSAEGQAQAIHMAIDDAAVKAADISYIEAHGTATPLGDPIEIEGLNIAFGKQDLKQFCAIGSVKSNLGHLTGASGVVGLIKTALSLHYKKLPPSINYTHPNPHIDFQSSPFYVNDKLQAWDSPSRIAGVSSFGVGGTNAHVIVGEAPSVALPAPPATKPAHLLCWSAKSERSLNLYEEKLEKYLGGDLGLNLSNVAYTLHQSRAEFDYRQFLVISDQQHQEIVQAGIAKKGSNQHRVLEKQPGVVFMFPGQGAQHLNMGKALFENEPVFADAMKDCAQLLLPHLGKNILDVIYPEQLSPEAEAQIKNTRYSQPALFCMGYALGKLWMSWGVFPSALVGHSIGEFVAAYFAGVFSLPDAINLIATRGKLMSDLPGGSMLSVRGSLDQVKPFLSDSISLAAVNSKNLCVVAGAHDDISALSQKLDELGMLNRLLSTSHAFHSYMMDPVVAQFQDVVKTIELHAPLIPVMSTVTGQWMNVEQATNPAYWAAHLRSTVVFAAAIDALLENKLSLYLELGPGSSAATLTRQQSTGKTVTVVASLEKEAQHDAYHATLTALGQLWTKGVEVNWTSFYRNETRKKINELPTYAFDHKDYWVYPVKEPQIGDHQPNPFNTTIQHTETPMRKTALITQLTALLEDASGIDMTGVTPDMSFIEMGLDSLLLTQVALILKKQFSLPITFRQLNDEFSTLDLLATYLDEKLPAEAYQQVATPVAPSYTPPQQEFNVQAVNHQGNPYAGSVQNGGAIDLISQQLQLLARQLALLQGAPSPVAMQAAPVVAPQQQNAPVVKQATTPDLSPEEEIEIKKPFGAAARIEKHSAALNKVQQQYLSNLIVKYNEKTKGSKAYTQKHRPHMADPRVVTGFKPATKELVYSVVINKSKGSRLWDIDGNEYIDALNGFGSNMLGYQPDIIKEALKDQIDKGYEIGPQHELAGEVSQMICEFTGFDRTALCNTGSEAVLGAMRIARTVTGRSLIVAFTGSYHGIADEVIVRGSQKLRTYPAAPGILPEAVQNMLILDYGTAESLKIIEERAHEIAAVLVEPVQSRRADFQPIDFLKKVRLITEASESVLIFDEVISGFRFHPGGVQAIFGIKADIGTYGKVAGGGISIGIIAGKRKYMDALDGGFWQYGDDSIPEIGVTYFAGTFVRHPLALATAKASLSYLKEMGPQLQEGLNANGDYIANAINGLCRKLNVPMHIAQFGSLWRIKFIEEYPYAELFFTLMRYKGIHILEGFACFLTTAHSSEDIAEIIRCFEESLVELKEVGLIPEYQHKPEESEADLLNLIPVPNAKLGKDAAGNPAWFIKDENNPGKYLQVN